MSCSARLLDHYVDFVAIIHLERLRGVVVLDALTIEDEATLVVRKALALAIGFHELLQLSGPLDLEENLAPVLRLDLDIELLATRCDCGGSSVLILACCSVHFCKVVKVSLICDFTYLLRLLE